LDRSRNCSQTLKGTILFFTYINVSLLPSNPLCLVRWPLEQMSEASPTLCLQVAAVLLLLLFSSKTCCSRRCPASPAAVAALYSAAPGRGFPAVPLSHIICLQ
jgi:hypothetical protein